MNHESNMDETTILNHLRHLVSADSSNPVPTVTPEHPVLTYAAGVLRDAGCTVTLEDLGGGCVNLLAVRGEPQTLFNCHLDTVKPNPNWTRDPFTLSVEEGRAFGLGACDIKGAAACMLTVAQSSDAPIAILLTTDEEAGKGTCVEGFLAQQASRWSRVVVAEPTRAKAVFQHRGFTSFEIEFTGIAGHTSGADASPDSAIHKAIEWGNAALALTQPGGILEGNRFNIGLVTGGTASNVIASNAKVRFGFRPFPKPGAESNTTKCIQALHDLLPSDGSASWTDRFVGPALVRDESMVPIVKGWGIETGPDVDFWTEAALFAAGGLPTIVLGPGDIAQAHASDEFVEIDLLRACASAYASIVAVEAGASALAGGAHAP
ncbi:MAG: acetylornithine deacetylase [Phycisphaerae bacterium]|nr:acetylornithine deacetylase [Phycisphaerae bacterium]MBM90516.1 acetylornithine deacetylase [Phycisphaerae bacterium]